MPTRGFKIRALGEIAVRCRDIATMVEFYRDVLGLEILAGGHRESIVFFKIAEGFGGHTTVLALFAEPEGDEALAGSNSSLHHLALTIDRNEQDAAESYFRNAGIVCRIEEFGWIGWRGLFVTDPEGNTVELVAYDPAVGGGT